MPYRSQIRVRFGDEDHAGIVYFPRFFDFFHQVFEDFFNDHGTSYRDVLDVDRVGWPAVHAEADFRSPLRFGDELLVDVSVTRMSERSASFLYRGFVEAQDGPREIVVGRTTVACIDMDAFRAMPIPPKYRELFERYLEPEAEQG